MDGQLRIDQMYAFIALDPTDNTEGVVGFQGESGWLPMVGADMEMVDKLRPTAEFMAKQMGIKVTLCVFSTREELEVMEP